MREGTRTPKDSQRTAPHSGPPKTIKHLILSPCDPASGEAPLSPRFYCEAKIDFADVRSGMRKSCSVHRALEIYPIEEDAIWTVDMVSTVDPARITEAPPGIMEARSLPAYVNAGILSKVEQHFLSYLLRYFEVRLFRNFSLGIYSSFDESPEDFRARCAEMLRESFRGEMDDLHDVFNRRLERLKEKFLGMLTWDESNPETNKSLFFSRLHELAEWLAETFLRTEFSLDRKTDEHPLSGVHQKEFDDKLQSFISEALHAISRLLQTYREKASSIDEYIIRPKLKDISLVRTCILWMPAGAQEK